jgi:hypothetical protein
MDLRYWRGSRSCESPSLASLNRTHVYFNKGWIRDPLDNGMGDGPGSAVCDKIYGMILQPATF